MKTLKLLIATSLISSSLLGQVKKEVSFLYGGKNDNQLILKKQSKKNENKFRRISFSNLSSYKIDYDFTHLTTNFNIGFGYEKRKPLAHKNFTIYRGPEFVTSVSTYGNINSIIISEKFKYNVGLSYTYKQFILGVENQSSVTVTAISTAFINVKTKIFNPYLSLSYKF